MSAMKIGHYSSPLRAITLYKRPKKAKKCAVLYIKTRGKNLSTCS